MFQHLVKRWASWRSHDKKYAKSAQQGCNGPIDCHRPMGQRHIYSHYQAYRCRIWTLRLAVDCLRLSQSRMIPEGASKDAITTLVHQCQTIRTPEGKDLWLRMHDGHTQYSSPFIAEVESATAYLEDEHRQAYWGEVNEPEKILCDKRFIPPQDKPAQARDTLTTRPASSLTNCSDYNRSTI